MNLKRAMVCAASAVWACALPAWAEDSCRAAREAMARASVIRHLAIKKAVPCLIHKREQVRDYILESIEKKVPKKRLEMEELVYKALGLIPQDFDYAKGIVDLYLSQLGGYYDPERKHFIMAGWLPAAMQPTIAAHELTHALQDQYYDLGTLIQPSNDNSDAQLARVALVEGDATAVMTDYLREQTGNRPISEEEDVNALILQSVVGMSLTSGLANIPQSLQIMLVFPYTSGLRFAHHRLRQGGYAAVDKVFRAPPRSTEEILHPEKYGTAAPSFVTLTDEEVTSGLVPADYKVVHRDVVGEFVISVLLGSALKVGAAASSITSGWNGDKVVVSEGANEARIVVWKSVWDSPKIAEEFLRAFQEKVATRYSMANSPETSATDEALGWRTVGGGHEVYLARQDSAVVFAFRQAQNASASAGAEESVTHHPGN